jgi:hypothetical protein
LRYSSSRISPGGIAGPSQSGSLVIILDADFEGMAVLPSERDPELVVHANAVPLGLLAFQVLEPIAGRNHEVVEPSRRIQELELPLYDTPERTRNTPGSPGVPFSEQVGGGFVQERLNHRRITCYMINV